MHSKIYVVAILPFGSTRYNDILRSAFFVTAPKRKRLGFKGMPPHPTESCLQRLKTALQDVYRRIHVSV